MTYLPIVPLCKEQIELRHVRKDDIIYDEHNNPIAKYGYPSRAGGIYDHFREVFLERFQVDTGDVHMIIQLRGCTAECPWCYLTKNGVWNRPVSHTPQSIVAIAQEINKKREAQGLPFMQVVHLIGGAPALYLDAWVELFEELLKADDRYIFHAGLLLNEGIYSRGTLWNLRSLCSPYEGPHGDTGVPARQLHIVSLKPFSPLSHLQIQNLASIVWASIPFYFVFTGFTEEQIAERKKQITDAGFGTKLFENAVYLPIEGYNDVPNGDDTQKCRFVSSNENGFMQEKGV